MKAETIPSIHSFIDASYIKLLENLNHASVTKYYHPFKDIAWDSPEFEIRSDDARWERPIYDALGKTKWYQSQPDCKRSKMSLELTACRVKTGIEFEGIVIRGLMAFAANQPNRSLEFRYALHECIEEINHSLMFQEFINRSPFDPPGLSGILKTAVSYIVRCARTFPELYFIFVLGGEAPIDYDQRLNLKNDKTIHPLMKKINQIHVTEEARHLCFAQAYLKEHVPKLSPWKMKKLQLFTPIVLSIMANVMLIPPSNIVKKYKIPKSVVKDAYLDSPDQLEYLKESMASIINLCDGLGLISPKLRFIWSRYNLL